jgi:hypothetical protein
MVLPTAFFSTELFWAGLTWLMILVVWGVFAHGIWREDRMIRQTLREGMNEKDAVNIMYTLHRRDMQIWLQLSLLLFAVAANDIRHDVSLLPEHFFTPEPPAAAAAPPVVKAADSAEAGYDSAIKKTAVNLPFSNITEFNEQNGKREAYIDWLKEHYESWLVTYYYLEKCKKTDASDYDLIHRTLEKDLTSAHAAKEVEGNILLAASGSYKEMYSSIPCDADHLTSTKSMYDANMQQIRAVPSPAKTSPAPAAQTTAHGAR